VGSVVAGAVIGAVLQNRLTASLREEALRRAGEVPAAHRDQFMRGFAQAGRHLQLRPGTGGPIETQVFAHAFADAMRPTMLVSVGVLACGLLACLFIRRVRGTSANPHGLPLPAEELQHS
jgi:hypothetical protein